MCQLVFQTKSIIYVFGRGNEILAEQHNYAPPSSHQIRKIVTIFLNRRRKTKKIVASALMLNSTYFYSFFKSRKRNAYFSVV